MKLFNDVIGAASKLCFLMLHILLAAWAIHNLIRIVRAIRADLSNTMVVRGEIVR